jgi:predicted component of type VI protein secretion system
MSGPRVALLGDFGRGDDDASIDGRDATRLAAAMAHDPPGVTVRLRDPRDLEAPASAISLRLKDLRAFSPEALALAVPSLQAVLTFRGEMHAMKGPFGCIPSVVRHYKERIGGEEERRRLRAKLGFPDDVSWDALALSAPPERRPAALQRVLHALDHLDEERPDGPFLKEALDLAKMTEQTEGYVTMRHGAEAMALQLLHLDCLRMPPTRVLIDTMVEGADQRMAAVLRDLLRDPAFARLETIWMQAAMLARHGGCQGLHARGGVTDARVYDALADGATELAVEGAWDLSHDAAVLLRLGRAAAQWGARVWFDLAPSEDALAQWDALRSEPGAAALRPCDARVLLRPPWGPDTAPVKRFNFDEAPGHDGLRWGSTATLAAALLVQGTGAPTTDAGVTAVSFERLHATEERVERVGPLRDLRTPEACWARWQRHGVVSLVARGDRLTLPAPP